MESSVKLRKSLSSKGRRSKSSSSSSSPPRSTPHDSDFDHIIAAQFDSVHKSFDQKLEAMSSSLISKFSSMLNQFQLGLNPLYPISTLPEHLHSTFPSHAKLPENTLTEKKNIPFPSLTLITCLTGPPVTPPPFTGRPSHTLSYTTILFLALKVNGRFLESLPVVTFASLELKLPVFSFH